MKKKLLLLDRDGTIIEEPPTDYQVDSFEKLDFLPKTLKYLGKIAEELDYELVMITNQDGLGTDVFPEDRHPRRALQAGVQPVHGAVHGDIWLLAVRRRLLVTWCLF